MRESNIFLLAPYLMGVVSAPAIHFGKAHKKLKNSTVLDDRMKQRAHYILNIAAYPPLNFILVELFLTPIDKMNMIH